MNTQDQARINAQEKDREYMRYMETLRDAELLSRRDRITLVQWRAEFAAWVATIESQGGGT